MCVDSCQSMHFWSVSLELVHHSLCKDIIIHYINLLFDAVTIFLGHFNTIRDVVMMSCGMWLNWMPCHSSQLLTNGIHVCRHRHKHIWQNNVQWCVIDVREKSIASTSDRWCWCLYFMLRKIVVVICMSAVGHAVCGKYQLLFAHDMIQCIIFDMIPHCLMCQAYWYVHTHQLVCCDHRPVTDALQMSANSFTQYTHASGRSSWRGLGKLMETVIYMIPVYSNSVCTYTSTSTIVIGFCETAELQPSL